MTRKIPMEINETAIVHGNIQLPPKLIILPTAAKPVFPGVFTPIAIRKAPIINTLERVINHDGMVGLVMTKDEDEENPKKEELYRVGTAAKIVKRIRTSDDGVHIFLAAVQRFRWVRVLNQRPPYLAAVEYLEDEIKPNEKRVISALTRALLTEMKQVMEGNPLFSDEIKMGMINLDDPGKITDMIASLLNIDRKIQQKLLETTRVRARMEQVLVCIKQEQELLRIQRKIQRDINNKIEKSQREYFLREELKEIKKELGMAGDAKENEYLRLKKRADELELPEEARERVQQELDKFQLIERASPEFQLVLSYLDTVLALPWKTKKPTDDDAVDVDIPRAQRILNRDHYKLDDVKERIIELMAVAKLNKSFRGSIICLVGPPGVGKTSIGKSIANALGKKFFRFSVGGMRDEAEIKGHRRTYIGAMPGKIIQGLRVTKERAPVFMIDEIDKLSVSYHGDPASALLEVLDPEQNREFRDHYLDLPFDISNMLFITTANTMDTIPSVLLDRMEVIRLSGYINADKVHIARRYLIPRSLKNTGLPKQGVRYDRAALLGIANGWAREAGLRNYEKAIDKIHRKIAHQLTTSKLTMPRTIEAGDLEKYLDQPIFRHAEYREPVNPGMVVGLAWTPLGGVVLTIESVFRKGKEGFLLTGQAGDVMQESAKIAYTFARTYLDGKGNAALNDKLIHVHIPAGATKKDGPSAGITMTTALISLALGKKIKKSAAMTGELSLIGDVLEIGGLQEKIIAAKRNGIKTVIFPEDNARDLIKIDDVVKKGMNFKPVRTIEQVLGIVL